MTEDLELSSYLVSLRAHRADSLIPQINSVYEYLKIIDDSIETYDKKNAATFFNNYVFQET